MVREVVCGQCLIPSPGESSWSPTWGGVPGAEGGSWIACLPEPLLSTDLVLGWMEGMLWSSTALSCGLYSDPALPPQEDFFRAEARLAGDQGCTQVVPGSPAPHCLALALAFSWKVGQEQK